MVDQVRITVRAGNGGNGAVSFRREKFIPKGGPDGGDGSKGGDVYLETDPNISTLQDFAHNKKYEAEDGGKGGGKKMFGPKGEDITIKVPVGTVVYLKRLAPETEAEKEIRVKGMKIGVLGKLFSHNFYEGEAEQILDMNKEEMRLKIARGGKGGRGNVHFKGPERTTPMIAEAGQLGEHFEATLELKLLADIGLVGLPNAGKSTLLSVLSNARPKIADYEFTTLEPNLGVLSVEGKHLVIADIPGLIEGASEGKGLGDRFLKHLERTRLLVHIVGVNLKKAGSLEELGESLYADYKTIRNELKKYGAAPRAFHLGEQAALDKKKEIVVINKIDLIDKDMVNEVVKYFKVKKVKVFPISCGNRQGIDDLMKKIISEA